MHGTSYNGVLFNLQGAIRFKKFGFGRVWVVFGVCSGRAWACPECVHGVFGTCVGRAQDVFETCSGWVHVLFWNRT